MKGLLTGAACAHVLVDTEMVVVVFAEFHECVAECHNHGPLLAFGLTAQEGSDSQTADVGLDATHTDVVADKVVGNCLE